MDQQRAQIAISKLLMPNSLTRPPPNRCFGQLTEVGVIAAQAPGHARELIDACDETIPVEACEALTEFVHQFHRLDEAIACSIERSQMMAQKDETASRLVSIPGFGPITASAMMPTIQDTTSFAGPREFAAFLGLTPKQNSSGGKPKLGRISKMGNRYLRKLLVVGAYAVHLMSGPAWFRPMPWRR